MVRKSLENVHKVVMTLILIGVSVLGCTSKKNEIPYFLNEYANIYVENPRKAALKWFDDARLGMFIHWGVWGPKHAAWAMYTDTIPPGEYRQMAFDLDDSGFDAKAIATLAKESGMNYITFVAKHHDGFSLWDSKHTDWDSMDYPVKRDFLKELSEACRSENIPLFIYYSLGIDWNHPDFIPKEKYKSARPHYTVQYDFYKYQEESDFERYWQFCKKQLVELCTDYGDIAGFWFDPLGGVLANGELFNTQEFYDVIHEHQPHALILFKTGVTGTEDVLVGERELKSISMHYPGDDPESVIIRSLSDKAWESNKYKKAEIAVTSQGSWEWSPNNKCQPADELYAMLQHAANNNANLLLNFGPKTDGGIPEDVAREFRLLGKRIQNEGYPPLNKTTWKTIRGKEDAIDTTETKKTAR